MLPHHLSPVEESYDVIRTCVLLYYTCKKKCYVSSVIPSMSHHLSHALSASACQLADQAVKSDKNRTRLPEAFDIVNENLLNLRLEAAWLTLADIRTLHAAQTESLILSSAN